MRQVIEPFTWMHMLVMMDVKVTTSILFLLEVLLKNISFLGIIFSVLLTNIFAWGCTQKSQWNSNKNHENNIKLFSWCTMLYP